MTDLPALNRQIIGIDTQYPERIVQFGAGNFLRAFVDWIVEDLNAQTDFGGSVIVVKVTPHGTYQALDAQDGLFHVHLEGIQQGEFTADTKLITCISRTVYPYDDYDAYLALARQPEIRFLISNTTEAGIQYVADDRPTDTPPSSFPAKLTLFLYVRYRYFDGAPDKGCIVMPTELIAENGTQLRDMILRYATQWSLETGFYQWIEDHNMFCNTLVDRIVSGYPQEQIQQLQHELGYEDDLLVMGEAYHSWIIEAPDSLKHELPVDGTSLNIKIVEDANPYRQTKVRILNGLHTSMVPIGYLLGLNSVRDCINHEALRQFLQDAVYQEIIPSMDLPESELTAFASEVFDRFRNPSIHHQLLSIAVNSSTKVKTRLLPTLQAYHHLYDQLPQRIVLAMAAFIRLYKGEWQGQSIPLRDDEAMMAWFSTLWQSSTDIEALVEAVIQYEALWEADLSQMAGLPELLAAYLKAIDEHGILVLLEQLNELSDLT